MKKVFLVTIILLLFIPSIAIADKPSVLLEKGNEAYRNGDYTIAAEWFRKAAEQGYGRGRASSGSCITMAKLLKERE